MAVPIHLPHHGPETADEEEFPFVEVDVVLFGWFAVGGFTSRAQFVGFVVRAQEMVDHGAALPGYDAGVGVLEGRHAAILADLEEFGSFDAGRAVTELP